MDEPPEPATPWKTPPESPPVRSSALLVAGHQGVHLGQPVLQPVVEQVDQLALAGGGVAGHQHYHCPIRSLGQFQLGRQQAKPLTLLGGHGLAGGALARGVAG